MAGIAGISQGNRQQALGGMKRAADMEEARDLTGMQMKQAYRQTVAGGTMSGAATGAMIGTQILPGWGTLIGGLVGAVAGYGASSAAG